MDDLLIRGATVVDGLANEPVRANVAVKDGRVRAIDQGSADATRVIDADGLVLAPGIVDLHTHYDAQATWDATLSPSPSLGVTTAVIMKSLPAASLATQCVVSQACASNQH